MTCPGRDTAVASRNRGIRLRARTNGSEKHARRHGIRCSKPFRGGAHAGRALVRIRSCALLPVLIVAAGGAWAQGEPPPELALPRVVVVGVDTLRIGGVKADLPVLESTRLRPLVARRTGAAPIGARTGAASRVTPSILVSVVGGPSRTLDWHVGGEQHLGGSNWSVRARRATSRDGDWGLGSWWGEEVAGSGGGRARAGLRWRRLGYRSGDGVQRVTTARPWVEWCGRARLRAGWAVGSRKGSWRDVWWADTEVPLHEELLVRVQGQRRAGMAARASGQFGWDTWHLHMSLGLLARDDGDVQWLGEGRGLIDVGDAGTVWVAGRRRALFWDPHSLLMDAPYTTEVEDGWTWAEVREEAELGIAFSRGPVGGEASAGAWRGRDHPQWESERRCERVEARGGILGLRVTWRRGIVETEGSLARLFSDVVGQAEGLHYTPTYRWSTRVRVRLGRGEFAVLSDGAGSRPAGARDLESFAQAGFEARVRLTTTVSITARGTNLLDEEYQLWEGYPEPGSRIVAGFDINL